MTIAMKASQYAVVAVALLTANSYSPVKAQVILEMSALTCDNYLEAPPERQNLMAAWTSGYFNAARNMPTVDLVDMPLTNGGWRNIAGHAGMRI